MGNIVTFTDQWIEQKMKRNCAAVIKLLKFLVKSMGSQLQRVKFSVYFQNKHSTPELLGDLLSRNLKKTKHSQFQYRFFLNSMKNRLSGIQSNFGFLNFLKEQGHEVRSADLPEINQLMRAFHKFSLTPIIEHFELLIDYLERLSVLLDEQVRLLEFLLTKHETDLVHELKELDQLDVVLAEEVKLFEEFVRNIPFSDESLKKYNKGFNRATLHIRNIFVGFNQHVGDEWKKNTEQAGRVEKAFVAIKFMLGAGFFIYKFQRTLGEICFKQSKNWLGRLIEQRRESRRLNETTALEKNADKAVEDGSANVFASFLKTAANAYSD
ncbi:hypothetical protein HN587_01205 [Candidatus Woesearchaeota archaeon]|jgi:hypothetical protein|nr:hypothetical protein [Candidatus Woesearchaeota archaeon]